MAGTIVVLVVLLIGGAYVPLIALSAVFLLARRNGQYVKSVSWSSPPSSSHRKILSAEHLKRTGGRPSRNLDGAPAATCASPYKELQTARSQSPSIGGVMGRDPSDTVGSTRRSSGRSTRHRRHDRHS